MDERRSCRHDCYWSGDRRFATRGITWSHLRNWVVRAFAIESFLPGVISVSLDVIDIIIRAFLEALFVHLDRQPGSNNDV